MWWRGLFTFAVLSLITGQSTAEPLVKVPFVGCPTEGHGERLPPPTAVKKLPQLPAKLAKRLAYYGMADVGGTLAPRGWHCAGFYGSSGWVLMVLPQAFDPEFFFSRDLKTTGPLVTFSYALGDTSGRFQVADRGSRFFPGDPDLERLRRFIADYDYDGENPIPKPEPYPEARLTRNGDGRVTYRVAPMAEGIATGEMILPGPEPILGAVALFRPDPDLGEVSVRLPSSLADLAPVLLRQVMPGD